MEVFVKRLVEKSDLSVLTKRMIREEYKKHVGRSHLDVEEKVELARLITNILENLTKRNETDVQEGEHDSPNEKENSNPTKSISRKVKGDDSTYINKSSPKKRLTSKGKNVATPNKKKKVEGAEKKSFSLVQTCSQNNMLNSSQDSLQKSSDHSSGSPGDAGAQSSGSKFRVDEVLDVVMNSEGDEDSLISPVSDESDEDEDEEDNTKSSQEDGKKEELKFKKYHLVEEDDEDTWKPFTPVKESKPVKGRIESSSDESVQLSSDGEGGKKISHSKNRNRKKSKKRIISSDEESASDYSECENGDYENKKKTSKPVSTSASKRRKLNSTEEKTLSRVKNSKCIKNTSCTEKEISKNVKKPGDKVTCRSNEKGKKTEPKTRKAGDKRKSPVKRGKKKQVYPESSGSEEEMPLAVIKKNSKAESDSSDSDEGLSLANLRKKSEEQTGSDDDCQRSGSEKGSHHSGCNDESHRFGSDNESNRSGFDDESNLSGSNNESNQSESDNESNSSDEKEKSPRHVKRRTSQSKIKLAKSESDSVDSGSDVKEESPVKGRNSKSRKKSSEKHQDVDSDSESDFGSEEVKQKKSKNQKKTSVKRAGKKVSSKKHKDVDGDSESNCESEKEEVKQKKSENQKRKTPVKGAGKKVSSEDSSSDSGSSDDETLKPSKFDKSGCKSGNYRKPKDSSSCDSDSSDEEPFQPSKIGKGGRKSESCEKPKSKSKSGVRKRESHITKLRKICREAGIFIRSNRELEGCKTDAHIVRRIKQILEKHGMKGKPDMKKAKKLRLKKEAAELDTDNIITIGQGRPKRRINSLFSRNSPSPIKQVTPPRMKFGRLKDIIESEESD